MASKESDGKSVGTLTRASLRDAAYRECASISRVNAREIVDATFDEIKEALLRGETVKLHSFGVLKVRWKRERIGRNPRALGKAVIKARRLDHRFWVNAVVGYLDDKGKRRCTSNRTRLVTIEPTPLASDLFLAGTDE